MAERMDNTRPTLSFSIDNILRDDFPRSSRNSRPSPVVQSTRNAQLFQPSIPCHECSVSARFRPVYIYNPSNVSAEKEMGSRAVKTQVKSDVGYSERLDVVPKMNTQGSSTHSSKFEDMAMDSTPANVLCKQENNVDDNTRNSHKVDQPKDKKKRFRSHFSQLQLQYLESIFSRQHYLSRDERTLLASALDMTELQVRNWFQNKRYQKRHREIQALQKVVKQVPVKVLVSDRRSIIPALGVRASEMRY